MVLVLVSRPPLALQWNASTVCRIDILCGKQLAARSGQFTPSTSVWPPLSSTWTRKMNHDGIVRDLWGVRRFWRTDLHAYCTMNTSWYHWTLANYRYVLLPGTRLPGTVMPVQVAVNEKFSFVFLIVKTVFYRNGAPFSTRYPLVSGTC